MKKSIMKVVAVIAGFAMILPLGSCFDGPWTDIRNAPYRSQPPGHNNYCAVACIQMWALFDGADESEITQDFIADNINFGYYGNGVIPEDIRYGVEIFTDSAGYLVQQPPDNFGQDRCIAGCIASIKDFRLSIVPFNHGYHAVLGFGYQWHYEGGQRVADKMYYHDPNPAVGPDRVLSAAEIKVDHFTPVSNPPCYWVVIGRYKNKVDGFDGYSTFLAEGGTYYGGPSVYDPRAPIN